MNNSRPFFLLGALWELARFVILFLLIVWQVEDTRVSLVRILWFGSPQLALVAAFLFLGWNPHLYRQFGRLLAAAKIFSLIPGIALAIVLVRSARLLFVAEPFLSELLPILLPFFVLLIDIILLVILLTYSRGRKSSKNATDDEQLPDFRETHVEDK